MKTVDKKLKFNKEINFNLNGNFVVRVTGSDNNYDYVKVSHDLNSNDVKIDVSETGIIIIDDSEKINPNDHDFNRFKKSITNHEGVISAVANFFADAIVFVTKEESVKNEIFVEICFGTNDIKNRSLFVDSRNLKIELDGVEFDELKVSAGNLKLNQLNINSNCLNIKSGNLKANLHFNDKNKKITVNSGNAKVNVGCKIDFNGLVLISGNNFKVHGVVNNSGDEANGRFKAKLNNGSVNFYSDDEIKKLIVED